MIGSYLLAVGAARPVDDDIPETVPAPERQLFGPAVPKGHLYTRPRVVHHQAADRPSKKRKRRR